MFPAFKLLTSSVITDRKRSLGQGNIFIGVCQEFCSQGGGGVCSQRGCLLWGVSVSGGVCSGVSALGGVCSWGCLLGGVCSGGICSGGCLLGGCLLWGVGVCFLGGVCSWGCLLPGGVCSGGCLLRGVPGGDPPMDTAAGGTHPTGMHSCLPIFSVPNSFYQDQNVICKNAGTVRNSIFPDADVAKAAPSKLFH